jgi:5'-deoxynucleotidase YfbR-like HD superfamily hydrolase
VEYFENLVLMKRLLRQGWVRAGVPQSSIESLADHSWSVAALTYFFVHLENISRGSMRPKINTEKALLIALFHDLPESEYFDVDKSINNVMKHDRLNEFLDVLEKGAIEKLIKKIPDSLKSPFLEVLFDHESEEYHIARIADLVDLLNQARDYRNKTWIDKKQFAAFRGHAIQNLQKYENQFGFIKNVLNEFNQIS